MRPLNQKVNMKYHLTFSRCLEAKIIFSQKRQLTRSKCVESAHWENWWLETIWTPCMNKQQEQFVS